MLVAQISLNLSKMWILILVVFMKVTTNALSSISSTDLQGTYFTTHLGVVTITANNLIARRSIPGLTGDVHVFSKHLQNDTHFVFRSEENITTLTYFGNNYPRKMYLCTEFRRTAPAFSDAFILLLHSPPMMALNNMRAKLVLANETIKNPSDVCTAVTTGWDIHYMVQPGSERTASGKIELPLVLQGFFQLENPKCSSHFLNSCGDQMRHQLKIYSTEVSTCTDSLYDMLFTESGELLALASETREDNTSSLILYNTDIKPHDSRYRFVCITVSSNSSHVTISAQKDNCSSTMSDKRTFVLRALNFCHAPTTTTTSLTTSKEATTKTTTTTTTPQTPSSSTVATTTEARPGRSANQEGFSIATLIVVITCALVLSSL